MPRKTTARCLRTAPVSKTLTYDNIDRLTGVCFQAAGCTGPADPFIRWT